MKRKFKFEPSPFNAPGFWIKAGFHCHTLNSDGGMTPEATVKKYRQLGYHCLGITDHRQVTPIESFSDDTFIGINSIENGGTPDVIGVAATEPAAVNLPFIDRVDHLAEQGAFTIAAHPTYCAVTPDVYLSVPNLMAMEIYNAYCNEAYANGIATELWDMVLGQGKRIWGVAGDDAHLNRKKRYYSDTGKAWLAIWTESFSRNGILTALKTGSFYSTCGPTFQVILVEKSYIRISCSPVCEVRWRTFGNVGFVDYAPHNQWLVESQLPEWFEPNIFVRIELVDHDGKHAWSNPIFLQ
ncbi:PHP domain-containing protein [candidate division KSB1 bacterium]|nr:PHP domain-containing protein [candidate division KSB1 bacterium]